MHTKVIACSPKFVIFDKQKLTETQHMIFGGDYVLIRPKTTGCTLHLANSHYRLKIGQIVLLAPFNPFRLALDIDSSFHNKKFDCDVLHFRLSGLGQTLATSQQFNKVKTMLDQSRYALLYEGIEITHIGKAINNIENTFELSQVLNLLTILDKLSHCTPKQYLLQNCIEISHAKRSEDKLSQILNYIKSHLSEHLTVAQVASHVYMAESTFSRFFHANMGVTFWQHVIEQRIRQAARLLIKTEHSISFIAADVGFSSISSFNCKFKEYLKITPKQYRQTHSDMREGTNKAIGVKSQIRKHILSAING